MGESVAPVPESGGGFLQPDRRVLRAARGRYRAAGEDDADLEKSSAAKPLWALLTSIDVFSLWMVFLLAVGFGVASRKTTSSAIWGVGIAWAIVVLVKVGWAAIF
jgi:hypothetical protein